MLLLTAMFTITKNKRELYAKYEIKKKHSKGIAGLNSSEFDFFPKEFTMVGSKITWDNGGRKWCYYVGNSGLL